MIKDQPSCKLSIVNDLIFDFGMHNGNDTAFYLSKGFKVVSVDAMLWMARKVAAQHRDALRSGQLTIVNRCLADTDGATASFFINQKVSAHSSANRAKASQTGEVKEVKVITITVASLFNQFGVPRYLKIDLEGADELVLDQLFQQPVRPPYVSCELNGFTPIAKLIALGYDEFQLINQERNYLFQAPEPAREGHYAPCKFTSHHTGLFGRELDEDNWVNARRVCELYFHIQDTMATGNPPWWFDVHARRKAEA